MINLIKLNSFFKVNHYITDGLFDLPGLGSFIVMCHAKHNRSIDCACAVKHECVIIT